ncbi:hypothetical protein ABPG77_006480 [Micractinium sp. CCAP 211/92]
MCHVAAGPNARQRWREWLRNMHGTFPRHQFVSCFFKPTLDFYLIFNSLFTLASALCSAIAVLNTEAQQAQMLHCGMLAPCATAVQPGTVCLQPAATLPYVCRADGQHATQF